MLNILKLTVVHTSITKSKRKMMNNKVKQTQKNYSIIMMLGILIGIAVIFSSCKEDDNPQPNTQNIVQVAAGNPDLSTLVSAINAAPGVADFLSGAGPYTVFAPTNAAFAKLDPDQLNNIISNPTILTALLQYHVVDGKVLSTDLSNGNVNTLLSGQTISVDVTNGVVINGSSTVTTADVDASNGVIHIVDEVFIPEEFSAQTIVQIAAGNPDFSILVDALSKPLLSDLLDAANNPTSDLTVFAPTNAAFESVLTALGKSSIDELPVELLREIVQYHIVAGAAFSTDLTSGLLPTLLEGESLEVNVDGTITINGNEVAVPDVRAINGVIHGMGAVLLPDFMAETVGTVAEVPLFSPDYTILSNALRKADLLSTVATTDDITVFAPDNAAFVAAGITSLDDFTAEELTPILLYHVVGAKVLSSELPADGKVSTLNADSPEIYLGYLTNDVVLINGLTQITAVDIEKSNGVIHTISRTLVPPAPNVVEIAAAFASADEDAEFTVLVSLLTSDSLSAVADALIAAENVTVFAPTDAAFEDISDVIPTLNADQLTNILQYHAAGARVFSTDLVDGQNIIMLNSQTTTVNINGSAVTLTDKSGGDDANVTEVNIQGSNGVIHVIDKVLLPTL